MARIIKTIEVSLTEEEVQALEQVKEIFDTFNDNDSDDGLYENCMCGCQDDFYGMMCFIDNILNKRR